MVDVSLREPVAHKLPISDEVARKLAVHHLSRRVIVKCPGCPFDYALVVPEEIWLSGKTDRYRESLVAYLKTSECGRHPSHIVWTRGVAVAAGQPVPVTEEQPQPSTDAEEKEPPAEARRPRPTSSDHLYYAVRCSGWGCNYWVFLCDLGPLEPKDAPRPVIPKRLEVTCPACNYVHSYQRSDVYEVAAQEPPEDWIDHPAFAAHNAAASKS
jgi:adenine-specific DNA methylase